LSAVPSGGSGARDDAPRQIGPGQRRREKNQRNHPGSAPVPGLADGPAGRDDRKPRKPRHKDARAAGLRLVPGPGEAIEAPPAGGAKANEVTGTAWTAAAETPDAGATFASLGVPAVLVAVLAEKGITTPFPIQAATLPDALAGLDILGRAQTGSGKTLGFSLPMVARLAPGVTAAGRPRGLVLVPTRELAAQVQEVLVPLARALSLSVATIYGGVSYRPQISALTRRTDIVVACPGRLADLIEQGHCDLRDVEITVIDEADHMADLGFLPTVSRLLDDTPAGGQRLLFSATLDGAVDVLAKRFMAAPVLHSVDDVSAPVVIEHHVFTVAHEHRLGVLSDLTGGDNRSLVFTRTKHGAERLAKQLTGAGIPAVDLHGNLSQAARARNLGKFSAGHVRVLVATDVAARGIHVDGIDLVIHADPPAEHKAYVHRSGRTARGGADGTVVTIQNRSQARDVSRMMRAAGVKAQSAAAEPGADVLLAIAGPPAPAPVVPEEPPARAGRPGTRAPGRGPRSRGTQSRAGRAGEAGPAHGGQPPHRRPEQSWAADASVRPRRAAGAGPWQAGGRRATWGSPSGTPSGRSGQFGTDTGRPEGKRHARGQGRES
jgi:superfamily II DNA/RNA helicase